jgi:hypothetical protein
VFALVQWRKRRWRCRTEGCPRRTFTEQAAQVPAGMRTTTRLRAALAVAVEDGRDQAEVAAAHRVSWPTVQRAVVARGAVELVEPEPVRVLGMDETRFGRPRWLPAGVHLDGRIRWVRTDPWETGFVDITGGQGLLGQVDGRTSAAVQAWLAARSPEFRAGIEVVVIDPHAGYAAAVRAALPEVLLAVDHFHLVMLANKAVTAVRQRVTRDLLGRRGGKLDPAWANRRLLLRGRERLSSAALARMWNGCVDHDPSGQILTAWIAKEELRALCATAAPDGDPGEIRDRLYVFYRWCADADIPELTRRRGAARRSGGRVLVGGRYPPVADQHRPTRTVGNRRGQGLTTLITGTSYRQSRPAATLHGPRVSDNGRFSTPQPSLLVSDRQGVDPHERRGPEGPKVHREANRPRRRGLPVGAGGELARGG